MSTVNYPVKQDVMRKSIYDSNNNNKVDADKVEGASLSTVAWADVTGKPSGFTPESHTHPIAQVDGLQPALDGKAAAAHSHALGDISGLVAALAAKSAVGHLHPMSEIEDLVDELNGKAAATHGHAMGDISGLVLALAGKAAALHAHAFADLTAIPDKFNAGWLMGYPITDMPPADNNIPIYSIPQGKWVWGITAGVPMASEVSLGVAEIATQAETNTGTDDLRYITPLKLMNSAQMAGKLAKVANLSDLTDVAATRGNLGLGTAATKDTGTSAGNVPILDGSGKIDATLLPNLSITDVFVVADQAARLALTCEKGDVAKQLDNGISYILTTNDPTQDANWTSIGDTAILIGDVSGLQAALDGKAPLSHNHNASEINAGTLAIERLGSGSALQIFRRNAANTAGEFVDPDAQTVRKLVSYVNTFTALAPVYRTGAGWALSGAASDVTAEVHGLVESATGSSFVMVSHGLMLAPSHGLTVGEPVYLSTTTGQLTTTRPTGSADVVKAVGWIYDANSIFVDIYPGFVGAGNESEVPIPVNRGGTGADTAAGAQTNLGLGDSATKNVGATSGTVAAGDDSRIVGAAQKSANLSDLLSISIARSNLQIPWHSFSAKSANYTVQAADFGKLLAFTTGTNNITAILSGVATAGFIIFIRKDDLSGGHVKTDVSGLPRLRFKGQVMGLFYDGSGWIVIQVPVLPWLIQPGLYDGFFDDAHMVGNGANNGFQWGGSGTITSQSINGSDDLGVLIFPVLTASGGHFASMRAGASTGFWANTIAASYYEARLKMDAVPDATNDCIIRLGMHDGAGSAPADGVGYFEFDRTNGNSNWWYCTANNSSRTKNDTGIAADTSYHIFRIFNYDTHSDFWIDDTYCGSITTDIPTSSARQCSPWQIRRNWVAGTTNILTVDWGYTYNALASPRWT